MFPARPGWLGSDSRWFLVLWVFFPLEFPPSRRLGTEEKEQMALVQGQAAMLDFSGISRRKKELCQFEG